jgi:hypothetical protein
MCRNILLFVVGRGTSQAMPDNTGDVYTEVGRIASVGAVE